MMVGNPDRTICEWWSSFFEHGCEIPAEWKHLHAGVLWTSEELNRKASMSIRENANVKGLSNLTVSQFCQWVNDELLLNETLEPGFPHKIETAQGGCMNLDLK